MYTEQAWQRRKLKNKNVAYKIYFSCKQHKMSGKSNSPSIYIQHQGWGAILNALEFSIILSDFDETFEII